MRTPPSTSVANSAWHWYPGILNDTRELFDALLDAALDFDIERPLNRSVDPLMAHHGALTIEQYDRAVTGA
jgi:hypothetical protein